ncbi:MAG TPA: hypothetical protein VG122_08870 [Gemmata sp.]|jgi:hypothetical protein|nr:hypothetical protein [Gemmata sp.]
MTEAEWLRGTQPRRMLDHLQRRMLDHLQKQLFVNGKSRKMRLFCAASCRSFWDHLADIRSREAVIKLEEAADGKITNVELLSAEYEAENVRHLSPFGHAAWAAVVGIPYNVIHSLLKENRKKDRSKQAMLLQEVFGNPFRPITLNPTWLTSNVFALAQQMYDSRDFSAMPILADAIQDAGCDNEDILNHCREPGEHVRGCWCVDLILGRQ